MERCRESQCSYPQVELQPLDLAALTVFMLTMNRWVYRGDALSGMTLNYHSREEAERAAKSLRLVWDDDLMAEVDRCATWYKDELERRRKAIDSRVPKPPTKQQVH